MRAASRIACLVTMTTVAVGGLAVGTASAGTGSLELLADDFDQAAFSADATRAAIFDQGDGQVYARDLTTGVDTLVSSIDGVTPAPDLPWNSVVEISRNGRYVSFASHARLNTLDTDFRQDIYLKDLQTGVLSLVSTTSDGQKGNLDSYGPAPVSDNGTVVFASNSGNFPPLTELPVPCFSEDKCLETEIYAKQQDGTLTLLSAGSRGDFTDAPSGGIFADISADGTKIAIATMDPLTGDDGDVISVEETFSFPDIFVRDLVTGQTVLASNEGPSAQNSFYFPSLSADGTTVAFQGMVTGSDPVLDQVFVRHLASAAPVVASQTADGQAANDIAQDAHLSADGGFLAFSSRATNLHPEDPDAADDIYLKDLATGELRLVSQRDDGTKGSFGGSQPAVALDGGTGVVFSTFLKNFDPTVTTFDYGWFLKRLSPSTPPPPPPADANGDGILDSLQPAGTTAGAFLDGSTTPATYGTVVDAAGLAVSVTDAPDGADGVLVTVGAAAAGSPRATISACGVTLRIAPGSSVVLTCGSVIVETLTGSVQAILDNGVIVVTIPAGSAARISDTATGAQVSEVSGPGVTVSVNGSTTTLTPGGPTVSFASRVVSGFSAPVDNQPVLNIVKAGRAVPLKWYVSDATGAPVTTLTSATVGVQHLACGLGTTTDEIEQTVAGASGLQNLGDGYYQLNWKTSAAWAGSCKTMVLDLGGGVTVRADFRFTR